MTRTPTCPACDAKFQHDAMGMCCRQCELPDELIARGAKAVLRWQKRIGVAQPRGGSFQRRRRAHGRPRGLKS